jgi:GcrA cell cycle regulator
MSLVDAIPPRKLIGAASPEYWKGIPNPWSDDRVSKLIELWKDGQSAGQIMLELGGGLTRNAVLGKVHRLGLSVKADMKLHAKAGNRFTNRRPDGFRRKALPKNPIIVKSPVLSHDELMLALARPEVACSFGDLSEGMCRFPYGEPGAADFTFCGRSAHGTYCAGHRQLCYRR